MTMLTSNGKVLKVGGEYNKIIYPTQSFFVLGKNREFFKINDNLYIAKENLDYIDENIAYGQTDPSISTASFYGNDPQTYGDRGLLYSPFAKAYIYGILPQNFHFFNSSTVDGLLTKLKADLGGVSDNFIATVVIKDKLGSWTNCLDLTNIKIKPNGWSYNGSYGGINSYWASWDDSDSTGGGWIGVCDIQSDSSILRKTSSGSGYQYGLRLIYTP